MDGNYTWTFSTNSYFSQVLSAFGLSLFSRIVGCLLYVVFGVSSIEVAHSFSSTIIKIIFLILNIKVAGRGT